MIVCDEKVIVEDATLQLVADKVWGFHTGSYGHTAGT